MSNSALDRLRAHFAQHNRRAIFLALLTALASVAAWALLYFLAYWFALLAATAARPLNAAVPVWLPFVFAAIAAALCFMSWILRRIWPDEMPRNKKSVWEIVLDFILAVPRMTLAVWGTLSALEFLNERDLELALRLLQRIDREEPMPLYAVPLEVADEKTREKILLALQITELIDLRKTDAGFVLALREDARALCQEFVRIKVR